MKQFQDAEERKCFLSPMLIEIIHEMTFMIAANVCIQLFASSNIISAAAFLESRLSSYEISCTCILETSNVDHACFV